MRLSYHPRVVFLSLVITLMACESDADKLQRLEGDRAVECLNARVLDRAMKDANVNRATTPYSDTLGKQYREAESKCTLASRELDRFMR